MAARVRRSNSSPPNQGPSSGGAPRPSGESEASPREPVEGGGLPRDQPGTVPGEGRQHGAQADALGADGDRGEQHPGVGKGRRGLVGGNGVGRVPEEHPIPARLLGVDGELNQGGGVTAVANVGEGQTEAHLGSVAGNR